MSTTKPKRLLYPIELIDRRVAVLQRDLRRLFRRYRRNELTKLQCLLDGEALIKQAFSQAEADVKAYVTKHGLIYEGNRNDLLQGLNQTLALWGHIVIDFKKSASESG